MEKFAVVANVISLRYHGYYDWFATGMSELADEGRVDFQLRRSPWMRLVESHKYVMPGIRKYLPWLAKAMDPSPVHCLLGEVRRKDKKVRFLIDIDDSPVRYWDDLFDQVDLYFKCQCPCEITPQGFPLNSRTRMPFTAKTLANVAKIRPAMIGRPLSRTLNLRKNRAALKRWEDLSQRPKTTRIFAFYTYDRGYAPSDVPGEGTLVRDYGSQIHHPEIKRGELVKWIKDSFHDGIDVRICRSLNPELRAPFPSDEEYPLLAASCMFNVNITGYGRSVPFRFIDSFMTGAAVPTDELALKWYEPFEEGAEIFDLGRLGYELSENAEWDKAKSRLTELYRDAEKIHASIKGRILENYRRKWRPNRFAEYVIREAEKLM